MNEEELITLNQLKEYDQVRAAKAEEALQTKQDKLPNGEEGQILTSNGDGTTVWKTPGSGLALPVGMLVELRSDLNPNDLFTGNWIELQENE